MVLPAVGTVMIRLLWVSNEAMEGGVAKDDVHLLSFLLLFYDLCD
jgi:hypothetical protein